MHIMHLKKALEAFSKIIIFRFLALVYMEKMVGRNQPSLERFSAFSGVVVILRKTSSVSSPRKRVSSQDAFETWWNDGRWDDGTNMFTQVRLG